MKKKVLIAMADCILFIGVIIIVSAITGKKTI